MPCSFKESGLIHFSWSSHILNSSDIISTYFSDSLQMLWYMFRESLLANSPGDYSRWGYMCSLATPWLKIWVTIHIYCTLLKHNHNLHRFQSVFVINSLWYINRIKCFFLILQLCSNLALSMPRDKIIPYPNELFPSNLLSMNSSSMPSKHVTMSCFR